MIDLRSDTVMQPTVAMRQAMAVAVVGDDFYGEDPTTTDLEEQAAAMLGMDAALFTITGTMANALALLAHGAAAGGLLTDDKSHLVKRELAPPSPISNLNPHLVDAPGGAVDLEQVEHWLRTRALQGDSPALICTENTHTWRGGAVVDLMHLRALRSLAQRYDATIHLDGARLFNACVALGQSPAALCTTADTVMISLCKGLGAPAGAVLAGPRPIIESARQLRVTLGGTVRRSGFYAAAALVALRSDWPDRIGRDHERAQRLCSALRQSPLWDAAVQVSQSNIVQISAAHLGADGERMVAELHSRGILASRLDPQTVRLVIHGQISDDDLDATVAAFQRVTEHVGSTHAY